MTHTVVKKSCQNLIVKKSFFHIYIYIYIALLRYNRRKPNTK